jgi:IMP dehydrogenase
MNIIYKSYTFDDVLLVPQFSQINPLDADLTTFLTPKIKLNLPIVSSAMDTVTDGNMAIHMALNGGIGVIHKNYTPENQLKELQLVKNYPSNFNEIATLDKNKKLSVAIAIGVSTKMDFIATLIENGADALVLDSAHGHSKNVGELLNQIKKQFPDIEVIVGNIATTEACKYLVDLGAAAIKVGMGSGSICTTRIVSGVGMPQLTALENVYKYLQDKNIPMIADGGIKNYGDIVKALAVGANTVMLGSMLAKTNEAAGKTIEIDGKLYKYYRGMGSMAVMKESDRYLQKSTAEGVEAKVEIVGSLNLVLNEIAGAIKSGLGYTGSKDIESLRKNAQFTEITQSGYLESKPHSVLKL